MSNFSKKDNIALFFANNRSTPWYRKRISLARFPFILIVNLLMLVGLIGIFQILVYFSK